MVFKLEIYMAVKLSELQSHLRRCRKLYRQNHTKQCKQLEEKANICVNYYIFK